MHPKAEYKEYVELVKAAGYTVDVYEDEGDYDAKNSDGYDISVGYDDLDEELQVYLSAPLK